MLCSFYKYGLNCVVQNIICAPVLSSFWGINHQEIASVGWKDQGVYVKSGIFKWFGDYYLGPYDVFIWYEMKA